LITFFAKRDGNTARHKLFFLKTEFFLQIVDISATMLEVFVIHDADLQINVGFDTVDDQLLQRILHASNRHVTVFTVANQLTDH